MRRLLSICCFVLVFINGVHAIPVHKHIQKYHINLVGLEDGTTVQLVWRINMDPSTTMKLFYCGYKNQVSEIIPLAYTITAQDFLVARSPQNVFTAQGVYIDEGANADMLNNIETFKNLEKGVYCLKFNKLSVKENNMKVSCFLKYQLNGKSASEETGGEYTLNVVAKQSKKSSPRILLVMGLALVFDIIFMGIGLSVAMMIERKKEGYKKVEQMVDERLDFTRAKKVAKGVKKKANVVKHKAKDAKTKIKKKIDKTVEKRKSKKKKSPSSSSSTPATNEMIEESYYENVPSSKPKRPPPPKHNNGKTKPPRPPGGPTKIKKQQRKT